MPSSAVRTFSDADDYAAAFRHVTVEMTVTEGRNFAAKLIKIDLHRLWMQRSSDNLPRIYHVDEWGGRAFIVFRTEAGPSLLVNGLELQPSGIVRFSQGQGHYQRSSGSANLASASLSLEDMASVGRAMAGRDLTPPRDMLVTPPPSAMTKLQRLHAAAAHLAETAPEIIANPDAARGLCCKLPAVARDAPARGRARAHAASSRSPTSWTASVSAHAPRPKARSTRRASPRMSRVRLKIAA